MIATMNLHRYFLILLVVLPLCSPLRAQGTDEDSRFYLGFAGSAVFPYDPKEQSSSGGEGINFKTAAGFTAAFGYAFKEGFSTEIEWGYQKSGIGTPTENLSQEIDFGDPAGLEGLRPPITIEIDGELKTQSLMGNVYYRYPQWRVSPYAGFGLGAFFHDGGFTSIVTVTDDFLPGGITSGFGNDLPTVPPRTTVEYQDSRFAYQIMGGLSVRASSLVEFRFGYRFRSSRGEPIDANQIEAGIRFRF